MKEGIADAIATMSESYSGNPNAPFDENNIDWSEWSESVFSTAVQMPIDPAKTAHQNASIMGRALYEMSLQLDFQTVARLVLKGVDEVALNLDGNSDEVSFSEMLEGMIVAANGDQSVIDEILDAWAKVGVSAINTTGGGSQGGGGSSGGGVPGAPNPPSSGAYVWLGCQYGSTITYLSWSEVSGATFYTVRVFGGGVQNSTQTTTNTQLLVHNVDVTVNIAACNASGCSSEYSYPVFEYWICGG